MSPVLAITVVVLYVLSFLLAWTSFSLRDFSRRRLDEICRAHDREERFGRILRNHDRALLAVDLLLVSVQGLLIVAAVRWRLPASGTLEQSVEWIVSMVCGLF
ncbi:MAG: hypothetical protein ABGZ17_05760, partial [Planctomycetaceae bacterium]